MAQREEFASLKESVGERIRKDIVTRRLRPGEIIRDGELALRYGVSTSPIREALIHLATDRLIEMPANQPKRIGKLDLKTAEDFFEFYRIVALAGFSKGAPRIGSHHLRAMESAFEDLRGLLSIPGSDRYDIARKSRRFFLPVYEASENSEIIYMISHRLSWIDRLLVILEIFYSETVIPGMRLILDSLLSGDSSRAVRVHFDFLDQISKEIRRPGLFDDLEKEGR